MRKILISLMLLAPVLMLGSCDILDRTDNVRFTELKPLTKAVKGIEGGKYHIMVNYWKNADGTWSTDRNDISYKYCGELWGMDGIPPKAVGYLVLTNDPGITFQEVLTSMYSSSSTAWIPAERALLIGFIY